MSIYNLTGKDVEEDVLKKITSLAQNYNGDAINVDILFSILYLAMIAEERITNTRVGKKIKGLGIYYLLFEKASISQAANFMRGMNWR